MKKLKSPIKYYGGKSGMLDIIKSHFPKSFSTYVEGFGGGASLLLSMQPSPIEIYNDLGKNVYSLFKVISDPVSMKHLYERLCLTPYSAQLREEYRQALKNDLDLEDRAYYYFYVNRTSFNGVGGFSQNLIVRRNMPKSVSDYLSAIEKLPEVHQRLSKVIIEHRDILDLLDKYNSPETFIYLDPPYVHSTRKSGTAYEVEMEDSEHVALINRLLDFKSKVLISGYDHPIYTTLSNNWNKISFPSPNTGSKETETLWMNY